MAKLLVDYLVVLQLIELALALQVELSDSEHTIAVLAIAVVFTFGSAFLMASAYWMAWAIIVLLDDPFDSDNDSYNCDAFLGSTEQQLFASLRAMFDHAKVTELASPRARQHVRAI